MSVEQLEAMVRVHHQLRGAQDVGSLFARAAEAMCAECAFDRAVVLGVHDGALSGDDTDPLPTAASESMRRSVREAAVSLVPGSAEHAVVRRAGVGPRPRVGAAKGALSELLALENEVLAAVAPEGLTLALLVVDRAGTVPDAADVALVEAAATLIAAELSRVVQRRRVGELVAEIRSSSTMAFALAGEALEAHTTLRTNSAHAAPFSALMTGAPPVSAVEDLFTERERRVAVLVVEGRSNREIADALMLSPDTVKVHVGRILRKLGASNRVEAVGRYLQLSSR